VLTLFQSVFIKEKKKMSADAPNKPKADPLLQLYKEAAWAIKWVDPDLYKNLTAPNIGENEKRALLIKIFDDQGTERGVVLEESGELNDAGKGILQALLGMSKSAAPASRPAAGGSGGKTAPRAVNKENQEELAKKFAFMLIFFDDDAAVQKVKEVIKQATGASYGTLTATLFNSMKPDTSNDDGVIFPDLPSFDLQEKLYQKLAPGKDYKQAIFDTLQASGLGARKQVFEGLTGEPREFKEISNDQRKQITIDNAARSVITAYRYAHEDLPE
jgi:hypothetical protein